MEKVTETTATVAAPEKVARVKLPHQNGVTQPSSDTTIGRLWAIADEISKTLGRPAPRADVVSRYMAEVGGANLATANTQYARWVRFHNAADALRDLRKADTAARKDARVEEKAKAKEEAKAAKVSEREAEKAAKVEAKAAEKAAKEVERAAKAELKAQEKAAKDAEKAAKLAAKTAEKEAATKTAPAA